MPRLHLVFTTLAVAAMTTSGVGCKDPQKDSAAPSKTRDDEQENSGDSAKKRASKRARVDDNKNTAIEFVTKKGPVLGFELRVPKGAISSSSKEDGEYGVDWTFVGAAGSIIGINVNTTSVRTLDAAAAHAVKESNLLSKALGDDADATVADSKTLDNGSFLVTLAPMRKREELNCYLTPVAKEKPGLYVSVKGPVASHEDLLSICTSLKHLASAGGKAKS